MKMVATAAGTAVPNVVGMIGTVASPSVQNAAMKVQWYGPLPSFHPSPCQPFLLIASTSSTRQTCRPSPKRTYTSLTSNASSRSVRASQGTRFASTTPLKPRSPPPDHRSPCAHQARSTHRRYSNPSQRAWARRQCARCSMLAGPRYLPLSPSFSPPSFPTPYLAISSALQALAHVAGCLALRTPRDAFLIALVKAAFPPRVVAVLDESTQAQRHAPPFHRRGSRWASQAAVWVASGSSVGLSPRNFACSRVLVAAAMFLAGMLGPSWFAALEALQNASYVLTTRGTGPPGSAALGPKTGVTSGTSRKRGGAPAEGLAGGGQQQQQLQLRQLR